MGRHVAALSPISWGEVFVGAGRQEFFEVGERCGILGPFALFGRWDDEGRS